MVGLMLTSFLFAQNDATVEIKGLKLVIEEP